MVMKMVTASGRMESCSADDFSGNYTPISLGPWAKYLVRYILIQ